MVLLAGRDEITDNRSTKDYISQFATLDATVIEYPEARHTLEFEPDREKFVSDLIGWLERGLEFRL